MPTWLWGVLAFFASDNIFGYLSSPILFYPTILIGSILAVLWQLEILPVLIDQYAPIAKRKANNVIEKTGLKFRF